MKSLTLLILLGLVVHDAVARACDRDRDDFFVRGTDLCIPNDDGPVSVMQGTVRVELPMPLEAGVTYQPMYVQKVGRSGDVVTILIDQACGRPFRLKFTVAQLEARLANSRGLVHHRAKRFAEAAAEFGKAAALDPDHATFATNLACAHALAGALESAATTLTTLAATNRPWVVWKLVSDPELASLLTHAAIVPLLTATGTFTLRALDAVGIGIVPKAWAVHRRTIGSHGGGTISDVLRVVDLVTGKVRFEIGVRDVAAVERFFAVMGFTDEGVTRKTRQADDGTRWTAEFTGGSARSRQESSSNHECVDYADVVVTVTP